MWGVGSRISRVLLLLKSQRFMMFTIFPSSRVPKPSDDLGIIVSLELWGVSDRHMTSWRLLVSEVKRLRQDRNLSSRMGQLELARYLPSFKFRVRRL